MATSPSVIQSRNLRAPELNNVAKETRVELEPALLGLLRNTPALADAEIPRLITVGQLQSLTFKLQASTLMQVDRRDHPIAEMIEARARKRN